MYILQPKNGKWSHLIVKKRFWANKSYKFKFPEVDVKKSPDYYLNFTKEIENAKPHDCVPVDSNFPLYLLYTSGTTGLPK